MDVVTISNETFKAASKSEKARMLAYDVLCHLYKPVYNLKIDSGEYFRVEDTVVESKLARFKGKEVLSNGRHSTCSLLEQGAQCQVCAKGALLVSKIHLGEDVEFNPMYPHYDADDTDLVLSEYFSSETADNIESLFEVCPMGNDCTLSSRDVDTFDLYVWKLADLPENDHRPKEEVALEQIMRNFLFNGKIDLENHPHPDNNINMDKEEHCIRFEDEKHSINLLKEKIPKEAVIEVI